jgi:hypothetical protein
MDAVRGHPIGTLQYGSPGIEVSFDDRALLHLQVVITAKLRRRESFIFTWTDAAEAGSGRSSIWLDPTIPLFYRYYGSRPASLNKEWLDSLMLSANSGSGMLFTNEPGLPPVSPRPRS